MLVKIEIPIGDYYGEKVFLKEFIFETDGHSPSRDEVVQAITKIHEESLHYPDYTNEEGEALSILSIIEDWRIIGGNGILMTNTFVEHPQYGKQPVIWSIIHPIKIN